MNKVVIADKLAKIKTRTLWEKVFDEDSIEFLDYYYENKCMENRIYYIEEDGQLVSMLHCNPYTITANSYDVTADYIVGVATDEKYRHQGKMAALIHASLNEMWLEGKAFAYLMPASEDIYIPFGFRNIYNQPVLKLEAAGFEEMLKGCKGTFAISGLDEKDFEKTISLINSYLADNYSLYTKKTKEYLDDLIRQYKSDGGNVMLIKKEDLPCGFFTLWLNDDGAEIGELVCFDISKSEAVKVISEYINNTFKLNNVTIRGDVDSKGNIERRIMARVVNVKKLLELIGSSKPLAVKLSIADNIIAGNNKTYLWKLDECSSKASECEASEKFDIELKLSIEELAEWIFNGKINIGQTVCGYEKLKYIKVLENVFINEFV